MAFNKPTNEMAVVFSIVKPIRSCAPDGPRVMRWKKRIKRPPRRGAWKSRLKKTYGHMSVHPSRGWKDANTPNLHLSVSTDSSNVAPTPRARQFSYSSIDSPLYQHPPEPSFLHPPLASHRPHAHPQVHHPSADLPPRRPCDRGVSSYLPIHSRGSRNTSATLPSGRPTRGPTNGLRG